MSLKFTEVSITVHVVCFRCAVIVLVAVLMLRWMLVACAHTTTTSSVCVPWVQVQVTTVSVSQVAGGCWGSAGPEVWCGLWVLVLATWVVGLGNSCRASCCLSCRLSLRASWRTIPRVGWGSSSRSSSAWA